jgi:hypothetical protein
MKAGRRKEVVLRTKLGEATYIFNVELTAGGRRKLNLDSTTLTAPTTPNAQQRPTTDRTDVYSLHSKGTYHYYEALDDIASSGIGDPKRRTYLSTRRLEGTRC